ncbi:MAG: YesL family protein [Lachnospiraceae bacterium]|nr:YesL family protein [Lachnospiraceae bacterium]
MSWKKYISSESKPFAVISKIVDAILLSVLFLVMCIPVITIGAAWTSIYYATVKSIFKERSYFFKEFFRSFKDNFILSTAAWMSVLAVYVLSFSAMYVVFNSTKGIPQVIVAAVYIIITVFCTLIAMYIFPAISRYGMNYTTSIRLALLMAVHHVKYTIVIFILTVLFAALMVFSLLYFQILVIFIPIIYTSITATMIENVLDDYMQYVEESDEDEEEEDVAIFKDYDE